MIFKKFLITLIITAFVSQQIAWASGTPLQKDATVAKENEFSLNGQMWGNIEIPSRAMDEATFVIEHDNKKYIYKILAHGEEGLTLIDLLNDQKHHINIPAIKVSVSKHCLFIVAPQGETTGFHVVRLIDVEAFAFKTAIPLFFIPTDSSLGRVKEVVARHSDLTGEMQEDSLLMKTDNPDSSVTEMAYKDVQEIIQVELIYLAMEQAIRHPGIKELDGVIAETKKEFESFYEDLYAELKTVGGEEATKILTPQLKELNWESSPPEELAQALATTDDHPELIQLKLKFSERLSNIILSFSEKYDSLMNTIELSSFVSLEQTTTEQAEPRGDWSGSEEDTESAVEILIGVAAVSLFIGFVLPKMLKKPFSQMAGEYSAWHYRILNKSWLRHIVNKINPEYLKTSESAFTKVVKKLGPQEIKFAGITGTADQWRRSFAQVSADTLTVIGSELLARPWFKKISEEGSEQAIFLNEPFDSQHAIWVQKNVLYHVLSNQIMGTIGNVAQLGVIEKQYNEIVANYLKGTHLDKKLNLQELSVNEQEKMRRKIADTIGDDLKNLEKEIAEKAKQKLANDATQTLTVETLGIDDHLQKLREKWAQDIAKIRGKELAQAEIAESLIAPVRQSTEKALEEFLEKAPKKPGVLKKCTVAFGMAVKSSLALVLGERFAQGTANLAKKSWNTWIYILEPGFWNGLVMQTSFRGSWSPSLFVFNRLVSLFFLCPFYIGTYEAAKNKFGFHSSKAEFAYGLAYGLVTSTVYNYIFVYGYEKPVKGTLFDVEIPILKYLTGEEKEPKKEKDE